MDLAGPRTLGSPHEQPIQGRPRNFEPQHPPPVFQLLFHSFPGQLALLPVVVNVVHHHDVSRAHQGGWASASMPAAGRLRPRLRALPPTAFASALGAAPGRLIFGAISTTYLGLLGLGYTRTSRETERLASSGCILCLFSLSLAGVSPLLLLDGCLLVCILVEISMELQE